MDGRESRRVNWSMKGLGIKGHCIFLSNDDEDKWCLIGAGCSPLSSHACSDGLLWQVTCFRLME